MQNTFKHPREAAGARVSLVAISKVTAYAAKQGVTIIAAAGNDGIDGNKDRNLVQMPADALAHQQLQGVGQLDLPRDLTWAAKNAWAPAIAEKNGKFYYYYSAAQKVFQQSHQQDCLGCRYHPSICRSVVYQPLSSC